MGGPAGGGRGSRVHIPTYLIYRTGKKKVRQYSENCNDEYNILLCVFVIYTTV